jgi:hypothetical protein
MLASYLRKKKAVLIFCPTKNLCETVAKRLSCQLPIQYPEYQESEGLTYGDIDKEIQDMLNWLAKNNKGRYFERNEVYDK